MTLSLFATKSEKEEDANLARKRWLFAIMKVKSQVRAERMNFPRKVMRLVGLRSIIHGPKASAHLHRRETSAPLVGTEGSPFQPVKKSDKDRALTPSPGPVTLLVPATASSTSPVAQPPAPPPLTRASSASPKPTSPRRKATQVNPDVFHAVKRNDAKWSSIAADFVAVLDMIAILSVFAGNEIRLSYGKEHELVNICKLILLCSSVICVIMLFWYHKILHNHQSSKISHFVLSHDFLFFLADALLHLILIPPYVNFTIAFSSSAGSLAVVDSKTLRWVMNGDALNSFVICRLYTMVRSAGLNSLLTHSFARFVRVLSNAHFGKFFAFKTMAHTKPFTLLLSLSLPLSAMYVLALHSFEHNEEPHLSPIVISVGLDNLAAAADGQESITMASRTALTALAATWGAAATSGSLATVSNNTLAGASLMTATSSSLEPRNGVDPSHDHIRSKAKLQTLPSSNQLSADPIREKGVGVDAPRHITDDDTVASDQGGFVSVDTHRNGDATSVAPRTALAATALPKSYVNLTLTDPGMSIPGCAWLIAITMTTVGYGYPYVPSNHFGRLVCVVAAVTGFLTISLLVAFVQDQLALTDAEEQVANLVVRNASKHSYVGAAGKVLMTAFRLHSWKKKFGKLYSAEIQTELNKRQRDLYEALREVRLARQTSRETNAAVGRGSIQSQSRESLQILLERVQSELDKAERFSRKSDRDFRKVITQLKEIEKLHLAAISLNVTLPEPDASDDPIFLALHQSVARLLSGKTIASLSAFPIQAEKMLASSLGTLKRIEYSKKIPSTDSRNSKLQNTI